MGIWLAITKVKINVASSAQERICAVSRRPERGIPAAALAGLAAGRRASPLIELSREEQFSNKHAVAPAGLTKKAVTS